MSPNRSKLILIAEDDESIRQMLTEVFRMEGFSPIAVDDGAKAWKMIQEGFRPSVILTDLMMPAMHGWELIERIRKSAPEIAEVPIVVLSANNEKIRPFTANYFLKKPMDYDDLLKVIAHFCY